MANIKWKFFDRQSIFYLLFSSEVSRLVFTLWNLHKSTNIQLLLDSKAKHSPRAKMSSCCYNNEKCQIATIQFSQETAKALATWLQGTGEGRGRKVPFWVCRLRLHHNGQEAIYNAEPWLKMVSGANAVLSDYNRNDIFAQ